VTRTAVVDASSGRVRAGDVGERESRRFLGGRGLAARMLYALAPPEATISDANNVLILSSGPLNGTPWPAAARYHLTFRSPLTGLYGYANAGGKLGPYLAHAGYDAVAIAGQAQTPVTVVVGRDGIRLEPADDLWGRTTSETETALLKKYPNAAVACIGPAGERGVSFASVMNDGGRAAARTGGGAVFGGKNVKAVVVEHCESRGRPPKAFLDRSKAATEKLLNCRLLDDLRQYGTPYLTALKNEIGDLPTRNHREGQVPFIDRIDAHAFEPYRRERKGCYGCPIRCGRISAVDAGPYQCVTAGPEYETIDSLGPQCDCSDTEGIVYANMLCNELGLDTLSTGATIAFAMECHEHGLLSDKEVDLTWGRPDAVIELIRRIARREGIGELLAGGVRRAASELGPAAREFAMEVKGLEIPSQEGRVAKAFGLGHATSNRGADHLYGLPTIDAAGIRGAAEAYLAHAMPSVLDPDDEQYKPDLLVLSEHYCAVADALGVCKFSTVESWALYPEDLAEALSSLGFRTSPTELLWAGERIVNLERVYNVRIGAGSVDDRLPARFLKDPLIVRHGDREAEHRLYDFPGMLARYYELRGWTENGIPTAERLRALDLGELVEGR